MTNEASEIVGFARIKDGDTIEINDTAIRLIGIDSCERGQTARAASGTWDCYGAASEFLEALIARRAVTCRYTERDRYGRILGFCRAGETDLNREMVAAGMAIVYRYRGRATVSSFEPIEAQAREEGRGLWATIFETPYDYRRKNRR